MAEEEEKPHLQKSDIQDPINDKDVYIILTGTLGLFTIWLLLMIVDNCIID